MADVRIKQDAIVSDVEVKLLGAGVAFIAKRDFDKMRSLAKKGLLPLLTGSVALDAVSTLLALRFKPGMRHRRHNEPAHALR